MCAPTRFFWHVRPDPVFWHVRPDPLTPRAAPGAAVGPGSDGSNGTLLSLSRRRCSIVAVMPQAGGRGAVPLTRDVGKFGTLLAIDRARQVLGFEPAHSWRDHVPA